MLLPLSSSLGLLPLRWSCFNSLRAWCWFSLTMSPKPKRRKCRSCSEFFFPDPRNHDRQHYCAKPACRQASKAASQRRWLHQRANRDYFRGPLNVQRVQAWRQAHPGYWNKQTPSSENTQAAAPQRANPEQASCNAAPRPPAALQDFCLAKDPGFIGLLSMITGATLQEDIAATARRVIEQGRMYSGIAPARNNGPVYDLQTSAPSGSAAANPAKL